MTKIALIGTAGRGSDNPPMTPLLWRAMVRDAANRIGPDTHLVSGGAAWADHLAVTLFLMGHVKKLTLYLPAPLLKDPARYDGSPKGGAGKISNFYHAKFSSILGIDSVAEIWEAKELGAEIFEEPRSDNTNAFPIRNSKVAKSVEGCLAYTWGNGDVPADGGTKNTWGQVKGTRTHVSLHSLLEVK